MTPAKLFGDRYQVGDTLGFGGMSEVHRGRDLRLGRDVAIKVLRADLARDPSFQTRFRREAQNAASLNHPAIVAVYDTGDTPGENGPIPYIVMEYVDGQTLRDILKREGPLPAKRAMEIMADVCAALDFSHRHGIVHRDVKPANIMQTKAGAVKVMDFGIARAIADGQATMTATAAVIGTAQYLSPEQARGEPVDARSDVYATGCVLYELLTGQPPFTGDSPVAIAYQHVREDAKAPSATNPRVPAELDSIVLKALNKNPMNRYQTAAEMRSDMVRALSGQAVHATPVMSADERTELLRATPARTAPPLRAPQPPLLAPPSRITPATDWEEEPPSKSKKAWTYVGIGALCLAVLGAAIWITINLTSPTPGLRKVAVPDVTTLSQEAATADLIAKGFTVGDVLSDESEPAQKGLVIRQTPSALTSVDEGTEITLTIGAGKDRVEVPNVRTMTEEMAREYLEQRDFQVDINPQKVVSPAVQKDTVVDQDPDTGESVPYGSMITLTFGAGPELTTIPDGLEGKSLEEARQILEAAKLAISPKEEDSGEPLNMVLGLGEDFTAGQEVPVDTPVTVTYSNYRLMQMPDLTNPRVDRQGAFEALKARDWDGVSPELITFDEREDWDDNLIGKVIEQTPAAGEVIDKSEPVSIIVGKKKTFLMQSMRDKTLAVAQQELLGLTQGRLRFDTSTYDYVNTDNPALEGIIIEQSLAPLDEYPVDSVITFKLYRYVPPVVTSTPPPSGSAQPTASDTAAPPTT